MGKLAPSRARTEQELRDRLTLWREHLIEAKNGRSNCVLTLAEIRGELDRLLDELAFLLEAKALK